MTIFLRSVLFLSFLLLAACAEQSVQKPPIQPNATAAAKPSEAGKPAGSSTNSSNVRVSENEGQSNSVGGTYYVQNRIFSSGGAVSGAMMGS